jgi:hypothetical protein
VTNRNYHIKSCPTELEGLQFTRREGGKQSAVKLWASPGSTVYVLVVRRTIKAANPALQTMADAGWTTVSPDFVVDNKANTELAVFKKVFDHQEIVQLSNNPEFIGYLIAAKNLNLVTDSEPTMASEPDADWPGPPSGFAVDPPDLLDPVAGATTNPSRLQSSIHILAVQTSESGLLTGSDDEAVLTIQRSQLPHLITLRFVTPVDDRTRMSKEEALRYIRVHYPNWNAGGAEITFGDRYSLHDDEPMGAALATMVLSVHEPFEIDPNVAVTGDVTASGRINRVDKIFARIHGAEAGDVTIVAFPAENFDQLVNTEGFIVKGQVPRVQIIGVSTLDEVVAVARTDRPKSLQRAIDLYAHIQQEIKQSKNYLHDRKCAEELDQVLSLCPEHCSAKLMLMLATNKRPKTFSPAASLYYISLAVREMFPFVMGHDDITKHQLSSAVLRHGLDGLARLRPNADPSVVPLIDVWTRYLHTFQSVESGVEPLHNLQLDGQIVLDAMAKLNMNAELMQKMLNDRI